MQRTDNRRAIFLICFGLALTTVAAFCRVATGDFLVYDDQIYVTENPVVRAGLSLKGIAWAFTHTVMGNWHPLTMLSHMLDCSLFGLNPAGPHVVNLLLHTASVILLFLFLQRSTGSLWLSAFAAALFGVHPLRVESVAWIAERKDVLSGLFFFLTLLAYARYVQAKGDAEGEGRSPATNSRTANRPTDGKGTAKGKHNLRRPSAIKPDEGNRTCRSRFVASYCLALLFFACGLMSKAMLVTLPFLLLLLDYWPLQRFPGSSPDKDLLTPKSGSSLAGNMRVLAGLAKEKLPFFALSAVLSIVTFVAQRHDGSMMSVAARPIEARCENAAVACVAYLGKTFWPSGLAAFYPVPQSGWPPWKVGLGVLVVVCGSFWAASMVRAGKRPFFTIGWFWFLGMLVPVLGFVQVGSQAFADRYTYLPLIGCFIIIAWGASELAARFRVPRSWATAGGLATLALLSARTFVETGYWKDSVALLTHCVAVTENNYVAENNLAAALIKKERYEEARIHCLAALRSNPEFSLALQNMALVLTMQGDVEGARSYMSQAVRVDPQAALMYRKLAVLLSTHGKLKRAIEFYHELLRLQPDDAGACNNLAWLLATNPDANLRNGGEAVRLGEHACVLTEYKEPLFVGTLAAAYAEAGRFPDALAAAQKAIHLAEEARERAVARRNRELLELYRTGKAFHEEEKAAAAGK